MYRLKICSSDKKEELNMARRNKIKTDSILKSFWKNNEHFADLFNAAVFDGRKILSPDEFLI